ncbi:hypothetical protein F3D69_06000 [Bacteroides ovatus]|uniref:Uncharacterized protein n=1 Tax=Bacteroides ovatus TaxID=28116 RepID=A0A5M5DB07_BACOV|nr:hypothetical protein F3F37_07410 [Bacteroides ovatus]KAA4010961.1 hypothetical protein F3D64_07285 [Bacteroides ovatus]KAA4019371.1 hypothetical protein F3D53_08720 [Bacteroides ovatus]KAA4027139.1 hypothetical protein F3D52_19050 [Bacteroides ovatus]KAA4035878.1 hypothetical protein F3D60_02795 [Bacteroides ovatus]
MTRDELYINNTKADLNKTDITLSYKSNLLTDISKIISNRSYTIRLPKTAKNLALIECSHLPSSISRYPYLKHKGTLLRNGIEMIKNANVVLLETSETIEVALTWGNVTNFAGVVNDGKKLTDITHGTVEGVDWVIWSNKGSNSAQFPLIDYGFNSGDPNVWYHPVVTVKWILDKIQEQSGVTFNFPSDKLTVINKMIIPLLTRNDSEELYSKYPINLVGTGIGRDNRVVNYFGLNINFNGDDTQRKYGETIDYQQQNSTVKAYRISYDSDKSHIKGTVMTVFRSTTISIDYLTVELWMDRTSIATFRPISYQVNNNLWTVGFNIDCTFNTSAGQTISLGLLSGRGYFSSASDAGSNTNLNLILSARGEISFGEKFPIVPNLPDIKQIDFIKAVASMVGLFALPDGENGIKFIPFDNLSANKSKAVDWTNRVIMAYNSVTPRNLQYTLDNIAQNNWFRYKEDDNVMGNYDGNIQVDDATIEYERDAITLPFSACSTKGGVAYIPLYSYNEEGELEYNKTNPRILLLDGTKGIFKGLEWTTLIANNYQTYKGLINDAKVVTEYIRLNSIELRDLEMDIPVYLAQYGCYLAIIEITTKENDICECKLLKL